MIDILKNIDQIEDICCKFRNGSQQIQERLNSMRNESDNTGNEFGNIF